LKDISISVLPPRNLSVPETVLPHPVECSSVWFLPI